MASGKPPHDEDLARFEADAIGTPSSPVLEDDLFPDPSPSEPQGPLPSASPTVVETDNRLLGLPFDLFERYQLTQRVVGLLKEHAARTEPLHVLDVGGHSSPLKYFLPHDVVTLLDVEPPGSLTGLPIRHDGFIVGSGTQLPFADASFEVVAAHDTLEHIPPEYRDAFLREVVRVSSAYVILNGPVFDPETALAEQRLARFLRRALSTTSRFLEEHLEFGLPTPEQIEKVLADGGRAVARIPNGRLSVWLAMNALKNYILAMPHSLDAATTLERTFNQILASVDLGGACYRTAYVASVTPGGFDGLNLAALLVASSAQPAPDLSPASLEPIVAALEDHASEVRRFVDDLRESEARLAQALGERNALLADRERSLAEAHDEIHARGLAMQAKDDQMQERDATIAILNESVEELRRTLEEHQAALAARTHAFAETEGRLAALQADHAALTGRIEFRALEVMRRSVDRAAPWWTRRRSLLLAARRGTELVLREGPSALLRRLPSAPRLAPRMWEVAVPSSPAPAIERREGLTFDEEYQLWLQLHNLSPEQVREMRGAANRFPYRPKISIVTPVYNTDPGWLREAIDSVRHQIYPRWELCLVDDGSTNEATRRVLRSYAWRRRIKVRFLEKNRGIAGGSNAALSLATGEYVGLLDHDDELRPEALFEVVKLLNRSPELDYIYSDEDKKEPDGRLVEPFFKPDWSPDLHLTINYVTHFSVYRRSIIERAGGFRPGYDGSQDYDLALRVTELTKQVAHIAKPLYTWRKIPGSAAASVTAKPFAYHAARAALTDAMQRRGIEGEVRFGPWQGSYRVKRKIAGDPSVAVIIPTRDGLEMLRTCINSIEQKSTYSNYHIVVVDNDSREPETLDYLSSLPHRVVKYSGQFNFSKIVNYAAEHVEEEMMLLLNNDTEVISREWIESMVEHAQRPEVAAVGGRLLFPDGRPQHEGVIVGLVGPAVNISHDGYFGLGDTVRNFSAVTAACMLTRRSVFQELGGFDERLGVAFNDIDFCLRARQRGFLIVYTPYALLYHCESASRGKWSPDEDVDLFCERWGKPGEASDPYYNPNLDPWRPFRIRLDGGP